MNSRGHHRVAARVLTALDLQPDPGWWNQPERPDAGTRGLAYYRSHVGPWVRRRLTGTSSGDGRAPKFADWVTVTPESE